MLQRDVSPERDTNGRPIRKNRGQTLDLKMFFDDDDEDVNDSGDFQLLRNQEYDPNALDDVEKWAESVMKYHKDTGDARTS